MKFKIQSYSIKEDGERNQEDNMYPPFGKATEADRLFIVCDGMGGHDHGEVASATVCETMGAYIKGHYNQDRPFTQDDFNQALEAAYGELDKKDDPNDLKKMGTTLTFLMLHQGGALVAHIGDSRVYHVRPSDQKIMFVTRDHSLVNDLIDVGELTQEEAKTYPRRNVITRAIQPHQDRHARADFMEITDIKAGDYFLLCTDGMLEQLEDRNIQFILSEPDRSDEDKIAMLKQASFYAKDNHTAYLIHIMDVDKPKVKDVVDINEENSPVAIVIDDVDEKITEDEPNEVEQTDADVRPKKPTATEPKNVPDERKQPKPSNEDEPLIQINKQRIKSLLKSKQKKLYDKLKSNKLFKALVGIVILLLICVVCSKVIKWKPAIQDKEKTEKVEKPNKVEKIDKSDHGEEL